MCVPCVSVPEGWGWETGIGRATLYKYFSDVESILAAWHEGQIAGHLQQLTEIRDRATGPSERLDAVLFAYASIQPELRAVHATELAAHMHGGRHVAHAHHVMHGLIRELIADAVDAGDVRGDVPPDELARYCLGALDGARSVSSKAAVRRLVKVTLSGLRAGARGTRGRA
jgi:AcrR family transcriptional regulator